jgi:hypothetical protein
VLETRGTLRRRECANGHRFYSEEVKVELADYRAKQLSSALDLLVSAKPTQTEHP